MEGSIVKQLHSKALVAGSAACALVLSACGGGGGGATDTGNGNGKTGGFNAAVNSVVHPSDKKGGTLKLANSSDIDSFDPARAYYAWAMNFQKSYYIRTLLTNTPKPGKDGLELQPDLAAAMPQMSADKKTYTFKLKSGLKFEDGTPITAKDVKYGVERIFAQKTLAGGPTYVINLLDNGQNYPGPYDDPDPNKLGLRSVETPDDLTIVFHLAEPFADFPYVLAMPGPSPVPRLKDTGDQYAQHPISSGPYMFQSLELGKKAVLVRNPNWDPATDKVRKALPDEVDLLLQMDTNEIDNELIDGTLDLDTGQVGVQPAAQSRILLNPDLKKNADAFTTGFTRYFAMNLNVKPFDNIHCRKAVQYAADKSSLLTARGGPEAGGAIAGSMLPPSVKGYDPKLDPFNTLSGQPQIDKAKQELKLCGHPDGFETNLAVRNKGKEPTSAVALQAALQKVGIRANLDQSDASAYFRSTIGAPSNVHTKGYGIMTAGWGPDWPAGYGFMDVLVDSRAIQDAGNNNLPELKDPEIDGLIDQAKAEPDLDKAADIWKQIDEKVMDTATYLPFVFDKALNYRNPKMTNVFVQQYWGMVDFSALGVS
jgi:peptide/nickel transport system substrate-binding protein